MRLGRRLDLLYRNRAHQSPRLPVLSQEIPSTSQDEKTSYLNVGRRLCPSRSCRYHLRIFCFVCFFLGVVLARYHSSTPAKERIQTPLPLVIPILYHTLYTSQKPCMFGQPDRNAIYLGWIRRRSSFLLFLTSPYRRPSVSSSHSVPVDSKTRYLDNSMDGSPHLSNIGQKGLRVYSSQLVPVECQALRGRDVRKLAVGPNLTVCLHTKICKSKGFCASYVFFESAPMRMDYTPHNPEHSHHSLMLFPLYSSPCSCSPVISR